ncbi:MAG: 3-deoxy-8-phosphooctulonate synthase, partial [Simkaniaceae bacterium]|nr:3-deoxy-8-phosphooctulonate synthase [Simkaniaceae bacterium]
MHTLKVKDIEIGKDRLVIISGPCVIESRDHAMRSAEHLKQLFDDVGIPFIFKSSFDKANRSSLHSYRGPGIDQGLAILREIKETFDLPIFSDIHLPEQADPAKDVLDIIQIPAFLCRQTDLLVAAANTGKIINIKKGQFMAPWDMKNSVEKVALSGNDQIMLTERGVCFGYNNLVSDMRSIPELKKLGYPVCFDAAHSVQLPGGLGHATGGQRQYIPTLAKSAIAAGADLVYIESHHAPNEALSDAASMLSFDDLRPLVILLDKLYNLIRSESCLEKQNA